MKEITISISDFKAKCLRIIDDLERRGGSMVTKLGRPVARIVPLRKRKAFMGSWKGLIDVKDHIVHFDSSDDWEVLR